MGSAPTSCPRCGHVIHLDDEFCPACGAELAGDDPNIGQVFNGAWAVRELIGVGAIGRVYLAEQLSLKKPVAIKVLRKNFARSEDVSERFEREALASSRLTHPNSITVHDFGESEQGSLFLVTEYIDGPSLAQLIDDEGSLDPARVATIMIQACSALVEAHGQGVIHRDLKPENIMIIRQRDGRDLVKVLDYGIAQLQHAGGPELPKLTRQGLVCGTPEYMSPEQARGETLDPRTDLYSLGVILYEAITGDIPFDGDTPMEVIAQHINSPPIPPRSRPTGLEIPVPVEEICLKAMAKEPAARYQSALEMQQALQLALRAIEQADGAAIAAHGQAPDGDRPGAGTMLDAPAFVPPGGPEAREDGAIIVDDELYAEPELPAPAPPRAPPPQGIDTTSPTAELTKAKSDPAPGRRQTVPGPAASQPDRPQTMPEPAAAPNEPPLAPAAPAAPPPGRPPATPPPAAPAAARDDGTGFRRVNEGHGMPAVFQLAEDDHAPPLELDTSRVPRATSSQPAPSRARRGRIGAWLGVIMVVLIGGALVAGVLLEGREGTSRPGASGVHTEIARVIAYSDLTEAQKRLFRKANRLILKERWAAATRILERLLERQPDFAEGHRQLGRCRLEQGFRTSAGDAYRRYLELDPHGRHVNQVQELLTTRGL